MAGWHNAATVVQGRAGVAPEDDLETGTNAVPALGPLLRLGLCLLLAAFALQGVFGRSLWGGNDTREGGMIWDMYRHHTYVTPTINGQAFLEKPPLLHWTALLLCTAAGRVNEGLLRLPAALYGLGTLVLVYLFVAGPWAVGEERRAGDARRLAAWAAVFTCGTAAEFYEYSRIVLTDIALTFVVTLSLFVFWRAWLRPSRTRWLAFLLVAAGSFYAKGLIGPALIWAAVGVFLAWGRRFRLLAGLAAAYVPLLLVLVLPWVAALYSSYGPGAVRFAFWDNQVGRFLRFADPTLPHDPFFINKEPMTYYLTHLPAYLAPWTLLLVPATVAWFRRNSRFRAPLHVFVACSLMGMLLLLHLSSSKVVNYALPLYPFLFIVLGVWLVDAARRRAPTFLERFAIRVSAWGVGALLAAVPVIFLAGRLVRPDLVPAGSRVTAIAGVVLAALLLGLVVTAAAVLRRWAASEARVAAFALAPAGLTLVAMASLQLVTPAIEAHRSYAPFVAVAREEVGRGRVVALAAPQQSEIGAFTFYLDRRLPLLKDAAAVAGFLRAPEPRGVIAPATALPGLEVGLAAVPHAALQAGAPGTVSRSFVLVINEPQMKGPLGPAMRAMAARAGASPR